MFQTWRLSTSHWARMSHNLSTTCVCLSFVMTLFALVKHFQLCFYIKDWGLPISIQININKPIRDLCKWYLLPCNQSLCGIIRCWTDWFQTAGSFSLFFLIHSSFSSYHLGYLLIVCHFSGVLVESFGFMHYIFCAINRLITLSCLSFDWLLIIDFWGPCGIEWTMCRSCLSCRCVKCSHVISLFVFDVRQS